MLFVTAAVIGYKRLQSVEH